MVNSWSGKVKMNGGIARWVGGMRDGRDVRCDGKDKTAPEGLLRSSRGMRKPGGIWVVLMANTYVFSGNSIEEEGRRGRCWAEVERTAEGSCRGGLESMTDE